MNKLQMAVQQIFQRLSFFIPCAFIVGCASSALIHDVPGHVKVGKLYLAPRSIEVGGVRFSTEEGFIVVNENPSDTLTRKNMLPVLRIRSANKNPGEPIFWLNGGPGLSNMKYRPFASLLDNHDIVLVGYRGVDGSIVLKSDEVEEAIEGTDDDLLSDKSFRSISEALQSFTKRLEINNVDLSHYTIVDVISDLESARKAFGYDGIHLLSVSYGTRVALVYSYLHPAVVSKSVMIGVNPPGRFTWSPRKIDEQLVYYDSLFEADSSRYDGRALSQSIRTALAQMPSRWSLFKLDPGKIRAITFAMLYHKRTAAIVFHCYRAAEQGDYSGLYALQRSYDFAFPGSLVWGDVFAKGSTDFDSTVNYKIAMRDTQSVMGSPFSLLIWGSAVGHWPIHKLPAALCTVQHSDVQTLLISGSVDFSTPAEYATNELLPYLPKGRQVILREMGHIEDILTLQRTALIHLLVRFYDEGIIDDSKFTYDPMNFHPPINLLLWTKVFYPILFILSFF